MSQRSKIILHPDNYSVVSLCCRTIQKNSSTLLIVFFTDSGTQKLVPDLKNVPPPKFASSNVVSTIQLELCMVLLICVCTVRMRLVIIIYMHSFLVFDRQSPWIK